MFAIHDGPSKRLAQFAQEPWVCRSDHPGGFVAEDDRIGATPVAVVSHSLWRRRFESNPAVVGTSITIAQGGIQFLSRALGASFAMTDTPIAVEARIDTRVLLFTLLASVATALLFGLAPALQSSRLKLVPALKMSVGVDRHRLWFTQRHALVACEITLSIVVLTVAAMFIRGFVGKLHVNPGFRTDGVLLMSFHLGLVNYSEDQARRL